MAFSSTSKRSAAAGNDLGRSRRGSCLANGKNAQPNYRPRVRASRILRNLLAHNPDVEYFTIRRIISSIDHHGPGASLMMFSIPGIVPVPGTADLVGPPTMAMSSALIAGNPTARLPRSLLDRSIPRRALALAIHAILPVLERAERLTKERWSWLCSPSAQRVIGVIVFLLALPLAFPILGFSLPHASSLFTIALGLIERDGVTIALGVTAGIASLVFFTAKGLTPRALAQKAHSLLAGVARQLTSVRAAASAIIRRAWHWVSIKLLSGPARRAGRETGTSKSARNLLLEQPKHHADVAIRIGQHSMPPALTTPA